MPKPSRKPPSTPAREAGYEVTRADARRLWIIGGVLVLLPIVVLAALHVFQMAGPERGTVAETLPPPQPRLQAAPMADLRAHRRAELESLTSYRWVDRDGGIAQIPIAAAMEIVAARGLPEFPGAGEVAPVGPMPGAAARPVPREGVELDELPRPERAIEPVDEVGPAPLDAPVPETGERQLPMPADEVPAAAEPTERRIIDLQGEDEE